MADGKIPQPTRLPEPMRLFRATQGALGFTRPVKTVVMALYI
jgi:hypothetical protein